MKGDRMVSREWGRGLGRLEGKQGMEGKGW